jgi:hypothetical protein
MAENDWAKLKVGMGPNHLGYCEAQGALYMALAKRRSRQNFKGVDSRFRRDRKDYPCGNSDG